MNRYDRPLHRQLVYDSEERYVQWAILNITFYIVALIVTNNLHKVSGSCLQALSIALFIFSITEALVYFIINRKELLGYMGSRYYVLLVKWCLVLVIAIVCVWVTVYSITII